MISFIMVLHTHLVQSILCQNTVANEMADEPKSEFIHDSNRANGFSVSWITINNKTRTMQQKFICVQAAFSRSTEVPKLTCNDVFWSGSLRLFHYFPGTASFVVNRRMSPTQACHSSEPLEHIRGYCLEAGIQTTSENVCGNVLSQELAFSRE